MAETNCPICQRERIPFETDHREVERTFVCRYCGKFRMSALDTRIFESVSGSDRDLFPYLSVYTRQYWEREARPPLVEKETWRVFAEGHRASSVSQKASKLLEVFARRTHIAGEPAPLDRDVDPPLIGTVTRGELEFVLQHLRAMGWTRSVSDTQELVTVKGWEELEPKGGAGIPGRSFVAMSFHESLTDAFELGIKPAVTDCGLPEPIRIDRTEHNEKICDLILAEVRKCQFLIADFTRQRPGAYFEAGFALGLGRPIIWCCHADDFDNLHFDTRQYNHIKWKDPEDLRKQLRDRIQATIRF